MIQRIVSTATLALAFISEVSAIEKSSSFPLPCVSTGVLLSGQTACTTSPIEQSSTTSIIASVSSIASVIPTSSPVEVSSTTNIIVSVPSTQVSIASIAPTESTLDATPVASIIPIVSSVETSSAASILTTTPIPYPHSTSTIYGTNTRTDELGSIVTETVILSTTICPITATEAEATPSPSSGTVDLTTTIQSTITSVQSAAAIYSTVTFSNVSTAIIIAASEVPLTTLPAAESSSTEIVVASSTPVSVAYSTSNLVPSFWAITPLNNSSAVIVLETATFTPEASTNPVSETAYTWSTTTTEGASTVIPIGSSSSLPASVESVSSVPSTSAGGSSGETTSVSSAPCVASGALISGQTACPEPSASSVIFSNHTTSSASSITIANTAISSETEVVIPSSTPISSVSFSGETTTVSSAACVFSGALLSGQTACPDSPIKAVSSSAAISALPSIESSSEASIILSTATVIPMQSAPGPKATSTEEPSGITSPIAFTPIYPSTSFITKPTSTSMNSSSSQTFTSSVTSETATRILIDTSSIQGVIHTFTFAMPSPFSATGTSDVSGVTAYPNVESGASKVSVRGSVVIAIGVMTLGLLV